ncbi:HK97 family phage prohead protease [Leifsonia sp. SIMBA_070]|uniref:HK97 family phage prohead protease n=1 Tax=Leifsonia sp. SIMBA_070 TaxID=3085810 RepID=UPI00397C387D
MCLGLFGHAAVGRTDTPTAEQVYALMKGPRLTQLSFAYDTVDSAPIKPPDGTKAKELRAVKLYEVSLVPVGANQDTNVRSQERRDRPAHPPTRWPCASASSARSARAQFCRSGRIILCPPWKECIVRRGEWIMTPTPSSTREGRT